MKQLGVLALLATVAVGVPSGVAVGEPATAPTRAVWQTSPESNPLLVPVYYYRGVYYPYHHRGAYYRYRYNGVYFNHRYYRGGRWRYY
jgi:hypothetical protein